MGNSFEKVCNIIAQSSCNIFWSKDAVTSHWGLDKRAIGVCSRGVRPGDDVILIPGVPLPVVVRGENEGVKLVGLAQISYYDRIYWGGRWKNPPFGTLDEDEFLAENIPKKFKLS